MSRIRTNAFLGVMIAIVAQFLAIAFAAAQQPGPSKSGAAAPQQKAQSTDASQADAKAKLLASQEWKQIYSEFQKWLTSQAIYTPAEIDRINSNLAAQVRSLPAGELLGFLDDWQARLKVLKGENLQEAQQWLGQYLSVLNAGFRRQTLKNIGLSDITNMSASQIEEAFIRFHAERLARQQQQLGFDQTRQQRVQLIQQSNAATRQALQQSNSRGARFGTNLSPYQPPKFNPPPAPRRQFFVDADGRIAFVLPY